MDPKFIGKLRIRGSWDTIYGVHPRYATHTLQFMSSQPWILTAVQVISFAVQIISY